MILGISLALLATIAHSGSFVFRKRGLEEVNYKVFILFFNSIGALLAAALVWSVGPGLAGLNIYKALPFVAVGIMVNAGTLFTTTMAIHEIGASRTHALTSASPLITAFLGAAFLGEDFTTYLLLGLVMIILGGAALSYRMHNNSSTQKMQRPVFGFSLALFSVVVTGVSMPVQKYGLNLGVTPLQGPFIQFLTGMTVYGIYLIATRFKLNLQDNYQALNYLQAGVLLVAVTFLHILALARLPATLVAGLRRTAPLFTVVLSAVMLKGIEEVDWKTFTLAAVIVTGAILAIVG